MQSIHLSALFNSTRPNTQFTVEHQNNDMSQFPKIAIQRTEDGTV